MKRNAYLDLCLGVQAVRRHCEGIRSPLAPATGVGASIYTHQLMNVQRILTEIRVRHLLADEVGLGKTVQALMVLNALRHQRLELRALIVVPDRLVPQWRDEILTRAHSAPFDDPDRAERGQYVRLAWEGQLRQKNATGQPSLTLTDIDPDKYDVLVIDELHSLTSTLQDRIVRLAPDFQHVLVLTATPSFQQVGRHAQLFAVLEPERTALEKEKLCRSERGAAEQLHMASEISEWPEWAASAVVEALLERDRFHESSATSSNASAVAMAHCAYRRVIRTRRTDYGSVLPKRKHVPIIVEPIGADADRQALMWDYFQHLSGLSRDFDPVLLAKRVILSPPSLEQRIDFLRRKGFEREGLLEQVKPLVHSSQGDARADALVDLLNEIWTRDPNEQVLVAAQDNLTVDYLYDIVLARLPLIGPLSKKVNLVAARIRQGMNVEVLEDLGGFGNETNENLEAFQSGEAQILFAPDAGQVGLNLQCARILVLYGVPWQPEQVEQWIGRLDRIGNPAAFSLSAEARTIDVYTIVQRGLVDEKVVSVLERFHVFERSVNLDGSHLEDVAKRIERAVLHRGSTNWHQLEAATEAMAAEDEIQELNSPLRAHLPWTVEAATSLRRKLDEMPPAFPVLKKASAITIKGPKGWDRALEGFTKLLAKGGEYHIKNNDDPHGGSFRSLWYQFGEATMGARSEPTAKVIFSFGSDPGESRSPRHAHAFINRRGDIATPPRRFVTLKLDRSEVRRQLRFLSFGDALHDELIRGWVPSLTSHVAANVTFFDDHEIWNITEGGLYALRVSILDAGSKLMDVDSLRNAIETIAQSATRTPIDKLIEQVKPFAGSVLCAIEADVRWARSELPASISVQARKKVQQKWCGVTSEEIQTLLNPIAHARNGIPPSAELWANSEELSQAQTEIANLREEDSSVAKATWGLMFDTFEYSLSARLSVIREEARDALSLAQARLVSAEETYLEACDRGNRAQITRTETLRDSAADFVDMTTELWGQRLCWLEALAAEVRNSRPREYFTAVLRAIKTR